MSLSRRRLLKLGGLATVALGTGAFIAGLRLSPVLAPGMQVLREQEMAFLRSAAHVILHGALPSTHQPQAIYQTLLGIDQALQHLSIPQLKLIQQLFDVCVSDLTRGPLTGIWGSWEQARATDVQAFLCRWRDSPIALLQQGYGSLLQLVLMSWYSQRGAWQHCGYPGPPQID